MLKYPKVSKNRLKLLISLNYKNGSTTPHNPKVVISILTLATMKIKHLQVFAGAYFFELLNILFNTKTKYNISYLLVLYFLGSNPKKLFSDKNGKFKKSGKLFL